MRRPDRDREGRRQALTATLRAIRTLRGRSAREVATAMGLELRAYERFEAGDVRPELDRIFEFARVCECDPQAIFYAVHLERPELATLGADNKLVWLHALAFERFSRRLGDRGRLLEASRVLEAFEKAFDELARELEEKEDRTRRWIADTLAPPPPDKPR